MQDNSLYISGKKSALVLFLLLLCTGICVYVFAILPDPGHNSPWSLRSVVLTGAVILLICFFLILSRVLRKNPAIMLTQEGLQIDASYFGATFVKWSEITDISIKRVAFSNFVAIGVTDPQRFIDAAKGINKMSLRSNHRQHKTPVLLSSALLPMSGPAVAEWLEKEWKARGGVPQENPMGL